MKNFKEAIAKRREIALYAKIDSDDWFVVWEVRYIHHDERFQPLPDGQRREDPLPGYVRITEPVPLEFVAISNDEVVRNAVESLNEEERKVIQELNAKLAQIRGRKGQLLALTSDTQMEKSP